MFSEFDFSALDDPAFKEDAVREEIIAPILRRAGYKAIGPHRVQRSQPLKHPFVMIGSKKHAVTIIPDYTLFHNYRPPMILDAKRPSEEVVDSVHVEQAYSYAIHPEVRCKVYVLCNGRQLSLFHTERDKPIFVIETSKIDERWEEVSKHFSQPILETPEILGRVINV
jgi:predicted type IV restriction endonuclease